MRKKISHHSNTSQSEVNRTGLETQNLPRGHHPREQRHQFIMIDVIPSIVTNHLSKHLLGFHLPDEGQDFFGYFLRWIIGTENANLLATNFHKRRNV